MLTPIDYLNLEKYDNARIAFTYMIQFAYEHNQSLIQHLKIPQIFGVQNRCVLDYNSAIQLQVISNQHGERPLMSILNRCSTAFGSRHFYEILLQPFTDIEYINDRYNKTAQLIETNVYDIIHTYFKKVFDIERMGRRMLLGYFAPCEWCSFDSSLITIRDLCILLENTNHSLFISLHFNVILDYINKVLKEYTNKLKIDECAKYLMNDIKQNIFKRGQYKEVDCIHDEFKQSYRKLEKINKALCDIIVDSARIDQNDRDGYFIQITKKRWDAILSRCKLNKTDHISIIIKNTRSNTSTDDETDSNSENNESSENDHTDYSKTIKLNISQFNARPISSSSSIVRITHPFIEETSTILIKLQVKLSACLQKYYKEFLSVFSIKIKEPLRVIIDKIAEIDVLSTNARNAIEFNYVKPTIVTYIYIYIYIRNYKYQ
jgi:DNA mismatch repair ATPase MutS